MRIVSLWGCLLLLALSAGCMSPAPSTLYILTPGGDFPAGSFPSHDHRDFRTLAIRTVRLAEYLDRPEIIIRQDGGALRVANYHLWAEPLESGIARVLSLNLIQLLASEDVQFITGPGARKADIALDLNISRFDASEGKKCVLDVFWRFTDGKSNTPLLARHSRIMTKIHSNEYEAVVAAHSKALEILSEQMADGLQEMDGNAVER